MFKDLVCVFVGPNDFLSYNGKIAALCSDYRVTANAGVHLKEARPLTDEEIEKLLLQIEKLGEKVEDRPPNDAENFLIEQIQRFHPEVRYIINSFHSVVEAKKKPKKKKKPKHKKSKKPESKEEPKADKPESKEEEPKADKPEPKEEKSGWMSILNNMFDWWENPDLSKEDRAILKEEMAEEKEKLYKMYRKNKAEFQKLDKIYQKNKGLYDYIGAMVDQGQIDAASFSGFSKLIAENPALLDHMNIPTGGGGGGGGDGGMGNISDIQFDLRDFESVIPELKDILDDHKEEKTAKADIILDLLEKYFKKLPGLDYGEIQSMRVNITQETLTLDSLLKTILDLSEKTGIKPYT